MPAAMPTLNSKAVDQSSNKVVAGVVTGDLPVSEAKERKRGERGPDKGTRKRRGTKKKCNLCEQWAPDHMTECTGRGGVTCLIVTAADGVDDALEHTPKMKPIQILRVCMPRLVLVQLAMLPALTQTAVNTIVSTNLIE